MASNTMGASNLLKSLQTTKNLHPTLSWATAFLSTQRPATQPAALISTAAFRLLASDITQTFDTSSSSSSPPRLLPPDIHSPQVPERRIGTGAAPVVVQVLDVEDMRRSKWEQLEALEAEERGEETVGRKIVRSVPSEDAGEADEAGMFVGGRSRGQAASEAGGGGGQHKVLLQDARGTLVYGFELQGIPGVRVGMTIGAKLLLRGTLVARGLALLEPSTVTFLGGKIEERDKQWRAEKKGRLKASLDNQAPAD